MKFGWKMPLNGVMTSFAPKIVHAMTSFAENVLMTSFGGKSAALGGGGGGLSSVKGDIE